MNRYGPRWQEHIVSPMESDASDSEIIERSRRAPEVFALLFDRHHEAVYAYAVRRVGRDVADDILSDVFLVAYSQRDRFDVSVESARPWLYGITSNILHRRRRSDSALDRLVQSARSTAVPAEPSHAESVARQLDAQHEWSVVRALLEGLDPGDREAVLLYAWEELTYTQIAEAMAIPVGTVRSRIHRARTYLRESLNQSDTKEIHP